MSYHRVLPPPPALASQTRAAQWLPKQDTLLQNRIMADDSSRPEESVAQQTSLADVPPSPSPTADQLSARASEASGEDVAASANIRTRSSATNESSNPSDQRAVSITQENTVWNAPSSICLCQPDPKVPRPRNAFILYRQHHQARVVAQNPGLANPDISKVIGDHWRQAPPEIKQHWKNLAEEEKIRHQRQYPDYRYQPRRSGRNNSLSSGSNLSAETENRRCAKCGGRSMNTPISVSSAGYLASASTVSPGTPYSANRPPSTPSTASSAKRFLQDTCSPPFTSSANAFVYRNRDLSNNIGALGPATPRYKRPDDSGMPLSPDAKRRRVMAGHYPGAPRLPNGPPTPYGFSRRKESLPRLEFMNTPTFAMGPPPRPHAVAHQPDSSLTLPPLQNSSVSGESTQAKSVEAMVMSMSTVNKVRVLAKASTPLAKPSPASPTFQTRGLIVAIDGQERAAVEQITANLNTVLAPTYAVQEFRLPAEVNESLGDRDSDVNADSLEHCHRNMAKYHALSSQLRSYITSTPLAPVSAASSPAVSPKSFPAKPKPGVHATAAPSSSVGTPSSTLAEPPSAASIDFGPSKRKTAGILQPIALVPGYQLTQTDAFASHIPIDDAWTPVEHWQWMAAMWRGTVGPDITIAVKAVEEGAVEQQKAGGAKRAGGGEVDVQLDEHRVVVVKIEKGGMVAEGSLRRLGFEVGEYVRGRLGNM
ncbi:MAG: hypothetical protein LQ349_000765 [Xanthoria aureola]|nr:MAG: hypothetical protein LQ349_000765 [Xanthoria aureola]